MTLYSKTMAGRIAAADQKSALAANLKDFLKMVDGKSAPGELAARWRNSQEAAHLLHELEAKGLIEVKSVRWSNSAANSSFTGNVEPPSAPTQPADLTDGLGADLLASLAGPAPNSKTPGNHAKPGGLDRIKDNMSTFILTHLPQHALPVLQEIEDLASYEQLTQMLAAYVNLTREAGRHGQEHVKSLRRLLEPSLERSIH